MGEVFHEPSISRCGGMAYVGDLKSLVERHVGSNPTTGTMGIQRKRTSMLVPTETEGISYRVSCPETGEICESIQIGSLFRVISDRINTVDKTWILEIIDHAK